VPRNENQRFELGRRIREHRTKAGITGQRLAESAQISASFLSEVERGLSEISVERLQRIASELGVDVSTLLGEAASELVGGDVVLPRSLMEAAEELGLSFKHTMLLFEGKQSLQARRSLRQSKEWGRGEWIEFYNKVKPYLDE
jgi:transcriptional regulator with XRE-family HTH domain